MFRTMTLPAQERGRAIEILLDGKRVAALEGDTLAATLLNAEVVPFRRTAVSGQGRLPLCLMGVCFDCLVEVDGVQNTQSCMVQVRDGMRVSLPAGARRVEEPK
ncbi:MAG TPA: (2Fe-2S)-binding protein [Herbaspirillum sp.]|uniref:(2Fe-2S)-binding protein n=1 Tax=Herbaspirillum sp. TaxID=1890675 RepID=UPI002D3E006A|nr:(2Fe-2S)-binding protein [Herbaspirillum sp.]HZG18437.1 (2Fe-2S)-binding protein [Herbaspirillum sp.]